MPLTQYTESPRYLRLHEADNVAVIVNGGGVSAGTAFGDGLRVCDSIPQSHKVALRAIAEDEAVLRYGQIIGTARPSPGYRPGMRFLTTGQREILQFQFGVTSPPQEGPTLLDGFAAVPAAHRLVGVAQVIGFPGIRGIRITRVTRQKLVVHDREGVAPGALARV